MPNTTILMSNVAAAMNRTELSAAERKLLHRYARKTRSDYCAGCTEICESSVNDRVPIGDVMRYLMYSRSYCDRASAAAQFGNIPENARRSMPKLDYSLAEQRCPQRMAIGRLMGEAIAELS